MRAWGEPVVTDLRGGRHNGRHELIDQLAGTVRADQSWLGEGRWFESHPVLTTAYAVLALQEAMKS